MAKQTTEQHQDAQIEFMTASLDLARETKRLDVLDYLTNLYQNIAEKLPDDCFTSELQSGLYHLRTTSEKLRELIRISENL